jgi:hydroxymethylbilane synthase
MDEKPIRIGTRGSNMALAQARLVRDRLAATHPHLAEPGAIEIVVINTVADRVLDRPLSAIGGKGLFTKELELALFADRIDLAVHSMKDVETWLPDGLVIAAVLPRDDVREAFLSREALTFDALPAGSRVGTSSLRRRAQVLERRPDLAVVPLRGNANTRLRKLADGECDATFLALCGLQRLGLEGEAREVLSVEAMLPPAAQGALGIECRAGDETALALVAPLACAESAARLEAERGLLEALDGSCRTPIAALAEITGEALRLRGTLYRPDGTKSWSVERSGPVAEAARIGQEAGRELRAQAGDEYVRDLQ